MFSATLRRRVFAVRTHWKSLVRMRCDKRVDKDKCPAVTEEEAEKQRVKNELVEAEHRALCGDEKMREDKSGEEKKAIKKLGGKDSDVMKPDETVEWRRPVRQQPPKVRLGFLPEDFFQFFYPKTGVTGPYVFMTTVSTFLLTKEIYVLNHEYYLLVSVLIILYYTTTKFGPLLAEYLDKEIDEYEALWSKGRNDEKNILTSQIEDERRTQWSSEGQLLLVEAKRENVGLQYEEAYRKRLVTVHEAVLKRLNYQVRRMQIQKRFMQENAVEWIVNQVVKSYDERRGKEDVDVCIERLKQLAAKEVS